MIRTLAASIHLPPACTFSHAIVTRPRFTIAAIVRMLEPCAVKALRRTVKTCSGDYSERVTLGKFKIGADAVAANVLSKNGIEPALMWAYVIMFLETVGGVCLIVGLFTRFFAATLAIEMLVALLFPGPADFVFLANAFHGVPDRPRLARAVCARLNSNGHFAIVNWHQRPREATVILDEPRGPKTELRLSPEQTIEAVEAGELTFDQLVEVPPYHYGAVFKRPPL